MSECDTVREKEVGVRERGMKCKRVKGREVSERRWVSEGRCHCLCIKIMLCTVDVQNLTLN